MKQHSNHMAEPDKIIVVHYDPQWPALYEHEAQLLSTRFKPERIGALEHYGSTSVPGLAAKPIIGIVLGLPAMPLNNHEEEQLTVLGYIFDRELPGYSYWKKGDPKLFTLAITMFQSSFWNDLILVRDYLRNNPKKACAYAAVKYKALADGMDTTSRYRGAKSPFLNALLLEAKQRQEER